ncbi:hypothetical protein [Nocardia sp. NBC_00416]|uniref:hypothetical protein n=1 Tax=Nocardia sp. NBC_00416 TaxID=2975991 RepID=UPI002E1EB50E
MNPDQHEDRSNFPPSGEIPLHVTYVCDSAIRRKLVRVETLMLWSSGRLWGLLVIAGVVMAGRRWAYDEGVVDIAGMAGAFCVGVVFVLSLIIVLSLWRLLFGRGGFSSYAAPGTTVVAVYGHDIVDFQIRMGDKFRNLPYREIKRLNLFRDVVYLRRRDGAGIPIPRELAPETALALMRDAGVRM